MSSNKTKCGKGREPSLQILERPSGMTTVTYYTGYRVAFANSGCTLSSRKSKGASGLNSGQQQLIKDGMAVLSEEFGLDRLEFFTLTLPGSLKPQEAIEQWAKLMKIFFQGLERMLRGAAILVWYVGRYELQERLVPHLHLVTPVKKYSKSKSLRGAIIQRWKDLVARTFELDIKSFANNMVDATPLRDNINRLSRYLTGQTKDKKVKENQLLQELERQQIPHLHQWHRLSNELKAAIEDRTTLIEIPTSPEGYRAAAWALKNEVEDWEGVSTFTTGPEHCPRITVFPTKRTVHSCSANMEPIIKEALAQHLEG